LPDLPGIWIPNSRCACSLKSSWNQIFHQLKYMKRKDLVFFFLSAPFFGLVREIVLACWPLWFKGFLFFKGLELIWNL
jgi:hypothetical protein